MSMLWPWLFFLVGWIGGISLFVSDTKAKRWAVIIVIGAIYIALWLAYMGAQ